MGHQFQLEVDGRSVTGVRSSLSLPSSSPQQQDIPISPHDDPQTSLNQLHPTTSSLLLQNSTKELKTKHIKDPSDLSLLQHPGSLTWRLFNRRGESEEDMKRQEQSGCSSVEQFPGWLLHESLHPVPVTTSTPVNLHYHLETLPYLHKVMGSGPVWVVVYAGQVVVGCSQLLQPQPRRASAIFTPINPSKVSGQIEVYQVSPLDPTKLSINLTLPARDAVAFGIDTRASESSSCKGLSGRFYEPSAVDLDLTPAPQMGTKDLYPAGDLSGKFGTLAGLRHATATLLDPTIMLFGPYSVIGRGVAIYDNSWRVVACADLQQDKARQDNSRLHSKAGQSRTLIYHHVNNRIRQKREESQQQEVVHG
ncbi:hypothetical protein Pcinc_013171 [Petrolisthes cinctipes]|uniref:Uncharacterized protein n=1 Tax=Petrolisthes cinctipes TaxID=88211 RepID=A0AAE1FXK5_PETCI|nr:hypothetical protein Pcinc_013171 [Petrolisthes cinctipes]